MLITEYNLETLRAGADVYVGTGTHEVQTLHTGLHMTQDVDFDNSRLTLVPKYGQHGILLLGFVLREEVMPGWYVLEPDPMTGQLSFNPRSMSLLVELR